MESSHPTAPPPRSAAYPYLEPGHGPGPALGGSVDTAPPDLALTGDVSVLDLVRRWNEIPPTPCLSDAPSS